MRAEEREALRRRVDEARRARVAPPACDLGTCGINSYWRGCRNRACREAHASYKREQRARRRALAAVG